MRMKLAELVNLIVGGMSAREIMAEWNIPPSKLQRALDSLQLARVLELERRTQTVQMCLKATAHLPKAIETLVGLMSYPAPPETARKAALALIAAATGVNLANPGVAVFPEEIIRLADALGAGQGHESGQAPTPEPDHRADEGAEASAPGDPSAHAGSSERVARAPAPQTPPVAREDAVPPRRTADDNPDVEPDSDDMDCQEAADYGPDGNLSEDMRWLLTGRISKTKDMELLNRANEAYFEAERAAGRMPPVGVEDVPPTPKDTAGP